MAHNLGSFLPQLRAFGAAGLCTVALFAIAAWIPNDVIGFVAWLMAVCLGLPISILTRVRGVRVPAGRLTPGTHTFWLRVFGALSVLLGAGTLGWQAYHLIVRRPPEVSVLTTIAQAVLVIVLIAFACRLLRPSVHAGHTGGTHEKGTGLP